MQAGISSEKQPMRCEGDIGKNNRNPPQIMWWYDLDAPCFGSAATGDIDNDGLLELVFGTYFNDEHVYAINADDGSLLWNYDTGGCNDASPVIADVDLDGELEVIIPSSSPYKVYCFDGATGTVEWSTSTGYPNCIDSPPAVADVDNDEKPEVILGAWYGHVFCLNGEDGGICWQVNLGSDSYFQAGPNILDLDGDGLLDIVLAQYAGDCRVYGLKGHNGSVIWYSDLPQDYMYHGGSFADIDEDGLVEIVIGSYDDYIYVLNSEDGSLEWSYQAPYYVASPTSIADLNNDGHLEIIFTSYNNLGVLSYTGGLLWSYTTSGSMFRGVSISDIDNNGILDVIFGADDGILRVLQGDNGQTVWTLDLEAHYGLLYQIDNAPVIEDFNNDGNLDVFIIGGFGISDPDDNNHGRGYAIAAGNGTGEGWPMFRHDPYHSASFHFQQNSPPIAMNDHAHTLINDTVWINVTKNDYDPDTDGTIDPTTVQIVDYPSNGMVTTDATTGNLTYTPTNGFVGIDMVNYTVSDNNDLTSNTGLVRIHVLTSDMVYLEHVLNTNWNLITISISNEWNASDLAKQISYCLSVSRWDATNQTYRTYIMGGPEVFDFPLCDGCGYFVDAEQSDILSLSGMLIPSVTVPLKIGWNLIGWNQDIMTTASGLAGNITGCLSVSRWDSVNQTYRTYIVGGPDVFDFPVSCGMGLFIDVVEESIWSGEG